MSALPLCSTCGCSLLAMSTMHPSAACVTAPRRVIVIAFLSQWYYTALKMSSNIDILPITHFSFSSSRKFVTKFAILVLQTSWHNVIFMFFLRGVMFLWFWAFLLKKKNNKKIHQFCPEKHYFVIALLGREAQLMHQRDYCILLKWHTTFDGFMLQFDKVS